MTRNCFGIPDEYRGWAITQGPDDRFYAAKDGDPEHSADSWEALEDALKDLPGAVMNAAVTEGQGVSVAEVEKTLSDMLDERRKWLASCERTLQLLSPEWERFEAHEGHDDYVARLYADHTSEARTHCKEIAALEFALRSAAAAARSGGVA
jgi:hypothetical protein